MAACTRSRVCSRTLGWSQHPGNGLMRDARNLATSVIAGSLAGLTTWFPN